MTLCRCNFSKNHCEIRSSCLPWTVFSSFCTLFREIIVSICIKPCYFDLNFPSREQGSYSACPPFRGFIVSQLFHLQEKRCFENHQFKYHRKEFFSFFGLWRGWEGQGWKQQAGELALIITLNLDLIQLVKWKALLDLIKEICVINL